MSSGEGVWVLDEDNLPLIWLSPMLADREDLEKAAGDLIAMYHGATEEDLKRSAEEAEAARKLAEAAREKAVEFLAANAERLAAERAAIGTARS
ncbi:MAG: hypothetical protein IPK26_26375, partial [Planctomycetes bacterium]|nr:hypothetical protein [Planctomycetota bacterium]